MAVATTASGDVVSHPSPKSLERMAVAKTALGVVFSRPSLKSLDERMAFATTTGGGGAVATRAGDVLDISSVDSSDDEVFSVQSSVQNSVAYGNGVLCDSPTDFVEHNDPMHSDSPTDNEVSKYSFYSRLTHYMEGHKISESNRAAVELCLFSEAGAFVRNMDPMKKDKKERFFFCLVSLHHR